MCSCGEFELFIFTPPLCEGLKYVYAWLLLLLWGVELSENDDVGQNSGNNLKFGCQKYNYFCLLVTHRCQKCCRSCVKSTNCKLKWLMTQELQEIGKN